MCAPAVYGNSLLLSQDRQSLAVYFELLQQVRGRLTPDARSHIDATSIAR